MALAEGGLLLWDAAAVATVCVLIARWTSSRRRQRSLVWVGCRFFLALCDDADGPPRSRRGARSTGAGCAFVVPAGG
ncbi:hypothetical protein FAIPA1_40264 [Frankia sp. AiPs1]